MFDGILSILSIVKELVKNYSEYRNSRKDELYNALEAINRAANRTKVYYNSRNFQNEEPNQELSDIWLDAASEVRNLDSDLYYRLLNKAKFWANPNDWNVERSTKARIFIDDILEDTNNLLNQ